MFYCLMFELTTMTKQYNKTTSELVIKGLSPWIMKRSCMDIMIKYQGVDRTPYNGLGPCNSLKG